MSDPVVEHVRIDDIEPSVVDSHVRPPEKIADGAAFRLSGTVVVLDAAGKRYGAEDGTFTLLLWSGVVAQVVHVEIRAGAWSLVQPAGKNGRAQALAAQAFVLGGRKAHDERSAGERVDVPADGVVDLVVRWEPRLLLHVRGRGEPQELNELQLAAVHDTPYGRLLHPGLESSTAYPYQSPVAVPEELLAARAFYVRSPGFAWKLVESDDRQEEMTVELEPGGDLLVLVADWHIDPDVVLRLRSAASAQTNPLAEVALGTRLMPYLDGRPGGEIRVEGLPVGPFDLGAEIGDAWRPRVVGRTSAEITAGSTATATLTLAEVEQARTVPLAGTLRLPPEWGLALTDFRLTLGLQDVPLAGSGERTLRRTTMELLDAGTGLYRWSAGGAQPGNYAAKLIETGFFESFELGDEGNRDVRIEVPPPCVARVRCTDVESGAPVTVERMDWAVVRGGALIPSQLPVRHGPDDAWEFRAPVGRVLVRAFGDIERAEVSPELHAGTNELDLPVQRTTGLRVVLKDGNAVVPWEKERLATLTPAEGQRESPSWKWPHPLLTMSASEPGLYTLSVPELPGYQPVPDALVQLEKGVVSELVIELVRAR